MKEQGWMAWQGTYQPCPHHGLCSWTPNPKQGTQSHRTPAGRWHV